MKKKALFAILISVFTLMPLILQSCTGQPAVTTSAETVTETEAKTETGTETGTEPEATETEPSEPRFNEGKVEYVKTTTDLTVKEFPAENVGKPVKEGDDGVIALFKTDFSDGDPTCGGKAIPREAGVAGVIDGKMYVPFSADSSTHLSGGWTTWGPDVNVSYTDNKQSQLSADLKFHSANDGAWFCGFVGCFVSNFTFKIPDGPGDGVWLSFNDKEGRIYVYAADGASWKWPTGNTFVTVDSSLISGDTHLDVICTEDKQIYAYLKNSLVLHIVCGSTVKVYDGGENEIYSGAFDMNSVAGGHYSLFVHGGGGLEIDGMAVYECSKGFEKHETTITATPVGVNKLGLDITDRNDVVGICYTMWFNAIHGDGEGKIESALNVTELKEKYGFSARYGFGNKNEQHNASPAFHYWAKPAQGYYRSTDKDAIRNNMTLLYNAGVDFIILDYTYATAPGYDPETSTWSSYIYKPSVALLDTIMEMRAEGLGTPYVVYWMGSDNMFDNIYKNFCGVEKWKDCFVYWNGKPFIMDWQSSLTETDDYTVRSMYGLRGTVKKGQWSYLEVDNSKTVSYFNKSGAEHVSVAVATQETYMSLPTAHGRDGGKFWNKQWQTAFEVRPKIVTVTWWNEWCAQLLKTDVGYVFTDNFDIEHSRDIEPMEGGHGDRYYRWLCEYIRAYRAGEECPDLTEK